MTRIPSDLWAVVHALSADDKRRLLAFATGSDRAPINGLGDLKFVVAKNGGDSDRCVGVLGGLGLGS